MYKVGDKVYVMIDNKINRVTIKDMLPSDELGDDEWNAYEFKNKPKGTKTYFEHELFPTKDKLVQHLLKNIKER